MNEWSAYMNLAYRFVSGLSERESVSFHPYANWMSHQATNSDLQRSVTFPDQIIDSSSVSHREGDFVTAFSDSTGQYDIVVTLFFIDTARNLVSYIETIHRLLRSGGRWINLGPLMYGTGPLVQLSLDEIVALSMRIGFEFRETDDIFGEITIPGLNIRGSEVTYGRNPRGLNKNAFQAQYWEAVKR
jgi:carnosine N-methyltransferase